MKNIALILITVVTILTTACEQITWSEDPLTAVPVYHLSLSTPIAITNSTLTVAYIDIYKTKDMVLESTAASTDSGRFYKYDIENYIDNSTETDYDVSFNMWKEDIYYTCTLTGKKSSDVSDEEVVDTDDTEEQEDTTSIRYKMVDPDGVEYYNEIGITVSEIDVWN